MILLIFPREAGPCNPGCPSGAVHSSLSDTTLTKRELQAAPESQLHNVYRQRLLH